MWQSTLLGLLIERNEHSQNLQLKLFSSKYFFSFVVQENGSKLERTLQAVKLEVHSTMVV